MTPEDKKYLREAAENATPGPWFYDSGNNEVESRNEKHWRIAVAKRDDLLRRQEHCEHFELGYNPPDFPVYPDFDCEYIAKCDPQTILWLLDQSDQDNLMIQDLLYQNDQLRTKLAEAERAFEQISALFMDSYKSRNESVDALNIGRCGGIADKALMKIREGK